MLAPVPHGATLQLRTLRRIEERGAPAGTLLLHAGRLWVREGRLPAPPLSRRGRGGSDLAIMVTFRLLAGLVSGENNLVSFEPFTRPGCYLAAPAGGTGGQVELLCTARGVQLNAAEARRASWRRHDPLLAAAHGGFQSYESLASPGFFLSTAASAAAHGQSSAAPEGYDAGDEAGTRLSAVTLQRKPADSVHRESAAFKAFAAHASFEEATGAAVYPPAAWFLQPPPAAAPAGRAAIPSAVLWPLSEVIDETYSVYWDLS